MPDEAVATWLIVLRHDAGALPPLAAQQALAALRRQGAADLAFTSEKGSVAGVVVRAKGPPRRLLALAQEHIATRDRGFVLVVELGGQFDAVGNSAGWRHVQRMLGG